MRILHIVSTLSPDNGGPPQVVARLATAQADLGHSIVIASQGHGFKVEMLEILGLRPASNLRLEFFNSSTWGGLWMNHHDKMLLSKLVQEADVLHVHGVWEVLLHKAISQAAKRAKTVVLTPHGMISHYGMRKKAAKKKLAMQIYLTRSLGVARFVQALSSTEAREIVHYAPHATVRIMANGVAMEQFATPPSKDFLLTLSPQLVGAEYVLFLARLDHQKGVDVLVEAFALALKSAPHLRLVLAGPDYGSEAVCRRMATSFGITKQLDFVGMVSGDTKRALLAHALCLAQPSRHEGFSVSLLEGLASGTPLVVSTNIDLPGLLQSGTGQVVPLEPAPISAAILGYVHSAEPRDLLAKRARFLVSERYTWDKIARQVVAGYAAPIDAGQMEDGH